MNPNRSTEDAIDEGLGEIYLELKQIRKTLESLDRKLHESDLV